MLPAHEDGRSCDGAVVRIAVRVVIVNRFFYPDLAPTGQLAADLAFDLAAIGRDVHVVTSRLAYDGGSGYKAEETVRGVRVHRVWTSMFGRSSLPGRMFDYLSFYAAATARLLGLLRSGDVVVTLSDPPLLSVFASLAAEWRGARVVNWVQDLFPEAAAVLGFQALNGWLGAPLRAARNRTLRAAAVNVALGERMAARMRDCMGPGGSEVRVIHNWADGAVIRPTDPRQSRLRGEWGYTGRFIIGYSGNMGRAHDIETLVAACVALKNDPDIGFVFTGGGAKRSVVQRAIAEHQLDNLRLLPYVDVNRLSESLGACDAHLVSLLPSAEGLIVPSKFYGIAAAARPAIFVGDEQGEVARLLDAHKCGICVSSGDVHGLVSAVRSLSGDLARRQAMGSRAREAFECEWDKPIALARWREVISQGTGH